MPEEGDATAPENQSAESSSTTSSASPSPSTSSSDATSAETEAAAESGGSLRESVVEVIKTVYDPEIPVDIYELGLVYEINVLEGQEVGIVMTLTSPMCPVAETLPIEVEEKVRSVEGVSGVRLDLVWDPPWNPDMMSEAAKLTLNF